MVSDNAQWINNNDNIVNLNNNISGVSNDDEIVSVNNIKKKIKKIHNKKKFKNNYKNVVELKNIYEPSDETYIETKFGDILIDEPTNIEPTNIEHIVEGLTGDGLNHTDDAVMKQKLDEGANVINDEYNSIKNSAFKSIQKPLIDFFGYLYSPSYYYGKKCVDWMDFGEIFKDNSYTNDHLNDIEYIDKLLSQIFWYCFMYIPFILIFFLAILLVWLKRCFRVKDMSDNSADNNLNIDISMCFISPSEINIFGNENETTLNKPMNGGGKFDFSYISEIIN